MAHLFDPFLAACTLVDDCTALVYNVLSGELTLRFILKALIVGALAGGIFGHYLRDLLREEQEGTPGQQSGNKFFTWISSGAAVLRLAVSFLILDSPSQERVRRLDARRVEDLRQLAGAVDLHWSRDAALPETLNELTQETSDPPAPTDPESGSPYEYRATGADTYELCASFTSGTDGEPAETRGDFWSHEAADGVRDASERPGRFRRLVSFAQGVTRQGRDGNH